MSSLHAFMQRMVGTKIEQSFSDPGVPESIPENREPEECGAESISLDDVSVKYEPKYLKDHLTLLGKPDHIKRIHRDHPEQLHAVRDPEYQGSGDEYKTYTGSPGKKKQDKKDK